LRACRESFWGLLAPLVILGGIDGGIFTATEAAVVAVFYAAFIGVAVYRTIGLVDLWKVAVDTATCTSPPTSPGFGSSPWRPPSDRFVLAMLAALGVVASVPQLSTWLPRAFGLR
jgi:TRAP-type C4-dicarboxylate transport system permease large subunit